MRALDPWRLVAILIPTLVALRDTSPSLGGLFVFAALGLGVVVSAPSILALASAPQKTGRFNGAPAALMLTGVTLLCIAQAGFRHTIDAPALLGTSAVVIVGFLLCITAMIRRVSPSAMLDTAADAVILLVAASTTLHLLGFKPALKAGTLTESSSLLHAGARVLMPLTFGVTAHALFSGIALVAGALDLRRPGRRVWGALAVGCGGYGLFVTDGRSAMGFAVVVILASFMTNKAMAFRSILPWIFVLFVPLFIAAVNIIPDSILEVFARSGRADEIRSGNQRAIVWDYALDFIGRMHPQLLFGYGSNGHVPSGVSRGYAYLFYNWTAGDPTSHSLHNSALQVLFDGGLVMLALYAALFAAILKTCAAFRNDAAHRKAFFLVTFLILSGGFEAVFSYRYREILYLMLFVATATWAAVPTLARAKVQVPTALARPRALAGTGAARASSPPEPSGERL